MEIKFSTNVSEVLKNLKIKLDLYKNQSLKKGFKNVKN